MTDRAYREAEKNRIYCLRFFYLLEFGWGRFRVVSHDGRRKKIALTRPPACGMRRLGYPSVNQLTYAYSKVKLACPEEVTLYERQLRYLREAQRRFRAAESDQAWNWYAKGDGNNQSVAVRTHIERVRQNASALFDSLHFRYRYNELLDRRGERRRARAEIDQASRQIAELRARIYQRMSVPEAMRSLASEAL